MKIWNINIIFHGCDDDEPEKEPDWDDFTTEQLQTKLEECIENEEFEAAALIRDELKRRRDEGSS